MAGPLLAALKADGAILSAPMSACATDARAGGSAAGGDGGCGGGATKSPHPSVALHTSRRPPLVTLPSSEGSLSTLARMSALSSATESHGSAERMSAAAPETCAVAIELPLR